MSGRTLLVWVRDFSFHGRIDLMSPNSFEAIHLSSKRFAPVGQFSHRGRRFRTFGAEWQQSRISVADRVGRINA